MAVRSDFDRRPSSRGRSNIVLSLAVALLAGALFLGGCTDEESPTSNEPPDDDSPESSGVLTTATDLSGLATIARSDGTPVLQVQAFDESGQPLTGLDITYLESSSWDLLAFTDGYSGDGVGTFALEPVIAKSNQVHPAKAQTDLATAVFILNLLDPGRGRLYDPSVDSFPADIESKLEQIRQVIGLDMIEMILQGTPGIRNDGTMTIGQYRNEFDPGSLSRFFSALLDESTDPSKVPSIIRVVNLVLASEGQDDSYQYRIYCSGEGVKNHYMIPLGVLPTLQITNPESGRSYKNPDERIQTITGTANCGPSVFSEDGGSLQVEVNGSLFPDQIGVGYGTNGTSFSSNSPFEMAVGENTFRIIAYASRPNRGLATGENGKVGEVSITVDLEEGESTGHPPVLSGLTYPDYFPCPEYQYNISFQFSDPDGDATILYEYAYIVVGDDVQEVLTPVDIATTPELSCLRGTSGSCSVPYDYEGLDGGDWIYYEIWVVDATGLASEHLDMYAVISGDCP